MITPLSMLENSQFILDSLMAHQNRCGALEEPEGNGVIRCSRCGLTVTKDEVPIIDGKGFTIAYY